MKQTTNYKLNLIETDDTFSPAPLNENAQTLDVSLAAETAARQQDVSGLLQRVGALETHQIATGTYTGADTTQSIRVGFSPTAVLISYSSMSTMLIVPETMGKEFLNINGFTISSESNYNKGGWTYDYLALR